MNRRLRRALAIEFGGPSAWPSYRGLLMVFLLFHFLLGIGLHLSGVLTSTFTMENLNVSYRDTVIIFLLHACVSFFTGLITSEAIDRLPVFPIILVACLLGGVLRALQGWAAAVHSVPMIVHLIFICAAVPLNDALFRSTLSVALKRILAVEYASDSGLEQRRRTLFVAIFYALHNVGDIIANSIYYRWRIAEGGPTVANGEILYLSAAVLFLTALIVFWMRRIAPRADRPLLPLKKPEQTLKRPQFWRYLGVLLVLVCVSSTFLHFDLTLTKHFLIELGPRSPFPLLQSINPAIVIVLTPIVQWTLDRWALLETYDILILGSVLSTLGCLLLGIFQVVPHVSLVSSYVIGIIIFSVGETIWAPRLSAYALDIAPEGSEAIYQALSGFSYILAMIIGPLISHALMDAYCTTHHCEGVMIWLIVGLVSAVSPLLLILTRPWLKG